MPRDLISNLLPELLTLIVQFLDIATQFSFGNVSQLFVKYNENSISYNIIFVAISNQYTDLLKLLLPISKLNSISDEYTQQRLCIDAAKSNSFEILKYMLDLNNRPYWSSTLVSDVLNSAVRVGNLEMVKWLYSNGCTSDVFTCANATEQGHLEVLQYLHENGCPLTRFTMYHATIHNKIDILEYLHSNDCPGERDVCVTAVRNSQFEVLKWFNEKGFSLGNKACEYAVENNRLDVLTWLREIGCDWDSTAYVNAINNDRMDIVQYLHENNCPWSDQVFNHIDRLNIYDVVDKRFEILEWLHKNGHACESGSCEFCQCRNV